MCSKYILILVALSFFVKSEQINGYTIFDKIFDKCATTELMFECLKINAFKIANRAIQWKDLGIMDGVNLIHNNRNSRSLGYNFNDSELQNLKSEELNNLLTESFTRFLEVHKLNVNIPRLLEEGRKKSKGGGNGALYWALAIKGSFLAMAYKGIAVMAGLALIMGKMALLLSAILGLKKLINNGHESTTFEIIKQPKYTEQYTHTTSYEDDGHHHRSYEHSYPHNSKRIYENSCYE